MREGKERRRKRLQNQCNTDMLLQFFGGVWWQFREIYQGFQQAVRQLSEQMAWSMVELEKEREVWHSYLLSVSSSGSGASGLSGLGYV